MSESRYDEILRRIAQRQQQAASAPQQETLSGVLDGLNALGCLEEVRKRRLRQIRCFGPQVFRGFAPGVWVCAALWHKPRSYYAYHTLGLLGIWALGGEAITVALGVKTLAFSAPAFSPESYYHHLKRRFDVYYTGDASPPPESDRRYTTAYDPARRLDIRAELEAALDAWAAAYA